MKNLITITSILAAGTLCANATVVYWTDLAGTKSSTASGTDPLIWDISSQSVSFASGKEWSLIFSVSQSSFTSGTDLTLLAVDTKNSGSLANNYSGLVGVTYDNIQSDKVSLTHYNAQYYTDSNAITSTTGVYKDATNLTFVVSHSSSNVISLSVYGDNSFSTALATKTGGTQSYSTVVLDSLRFGATNSTYTQGGTFAANDSVGSFTLLGAAVSTSSVVTSTELTSYYNAQVIPEPSMFGLLAGTLALGLAGTRRRRR